MTTSPPHAPSATSFLLPAWARVIAAILAFVIAAFTPLPVGLLLEGAGLGSGPEASDLEALSVLAVLSGSALAVYLLLAGVLVRAVDRRPRSALGLRLSPRAILALLCGIAVSVLVMLVAQLVLAAVGAGRPLEFEDPTGSPAWVVLVYVLLLAFVLQGIGEEALFRGYLLQSLSSRPITAVVVSAAAFASFHLVSRGGQRGPLEHVLYLALPFGFAISAGFLAIALGSAWAAIGVHGGLHLSTALGVALGLVADGPAMWVLAGALHVVAGVLVATRLPVLRWARMRTDGPYGR